MPSERNHEKLQLALDSYRDPRDLAQPEMAELAAELSLQEGVRRSLEDSLQQDRGIRQRLDAVEPPAGFVGRLLEAIDAAKSEAETTVSRNGSRNNSQPAGPKSTRRIGRRTWLILGALAASALLGVGMLFRSPQLTAQRLEQESIRLLAEPADQREWSAEVKAAEKRFPYAKWLRVRPIRYAVATLGGESAAIYDLADAESARAILVVLPTERRWNLASSPDFGGYSSGATPRTVSWQDANVVYVLALETLAQEKHGSPGDYLKRPAVALGTVRPDFFASR